MVEIKELRTPGRNPAKFFCRDGSCDHAMALAIADSDVYRLSRFQGLKWAMDVGAHIGEVAISLALDIPGLKVLAVEPVPENVQVLVRNIELNGLTDRVFPVSGAVGKSSGHMDCHYGYTHIPGVTDLYTDMHKFVGEAFGELGDPITIQVPVFNLGMLLGQYDIDELDLMVIDCEGAEWEFFDTSFLGKIKHILGEYHAGLPSLPNWRADAGNHIIDVLSPTHKVTLINPLETLVGTFEAVRR